MPTVAFETLNEVGRYKMQVSNTLIDSSTKDYASKKLYHEQLTRIGFGGNLSSIPSCKRSNAVIKFPHVSNEVAGQTMGFASVEDQTGDVSKLHPVKEAQSFSSSLLVHNRPPWSSQYS